MKNQEVDDVQHSHVVTWIELIVLSAILAGYLIF